MTPLVNQLVSGDVSTSTRQKQKDLYCPESRDGWMMDGRWIVSLLIYWQTDW